MKKALSVLLSVIFALCLLFTLLLSVVRFNFRYSAILDVAAQMMGMASKSAPQYDDGLFHPDGRTISLAQYDFDERSGASLFDVSGVVQSFLQDYDVDVESELITEILSAPEVSDFIDKYAAEMVDYVTGAKADLEINADDITRVINKSIDIYEERTGETVDRSGIDKAVEASVEAALPEIVAALDEVREETADIFGWLRTLRLLLSLRFFVICVVCCAVLALAILLINRDVFAWLRFVSVPAIAVGAVIFVCAIVGASVVPSALSDFLRDAGLPDGIFAVVWAYAGRILSQMRVYGIVTVLCGAAMCVPGFLLGRKASSAE